MNFRPDKRLIAAALCLAVLGRAVLGWPLAAAPGDDAIAQAVAAIDRGDGLAAEIAGKRALELGAPREQVAALIGEGELLQGDIVDARRWLEDGAFDGASYERGYHALARLEMGEGNLSASAHAFDQLLERGEGSALVWVDIGRMRYSAGEHHAALEAASHAVDLDSQEPRALEFLAQLVRDAQGFNAALPLFREALQMAPDDMGLLAQYAASLGEVGQNQAMLRSIRHMVEVDSRDPRAFYLQSVLAARAGNSDLARRILWRSNSAYDDQPAGMLLTGVLEYRAGNFALAVEEFDALRRLQPMNQTAQLLYGRALLAHGEANEAVAVLEAMALRPDASNYLLTLVGRAYEQLGRRDLAAPFLDRAAQLRDSLTAYPAHTDRARAAYSGNPSVQLRGLLAQGQVEPARTMVADAQNRFPGSVDYQLLSGDVALLTGSPEEALAQYRQVALVRSNWPLVQRMAVSLQVSGGRQEARRILSRYLTGNPNNPNAAIMLGRLQAGDGNLEAAVLLLRHAAGQGGGLADPMLRSDLSALELQMGHIDQALAHALAAYRLQPSSVRVSRALAGAFAAQSQDNGDVVQALLWQAERRAERQAGEQAVN